MKISSISQAEDVLQKYVPNVKSYNGDDMSLDRMWPLLEAVGNPHEKLRAIHLAGTSGKTSTAYYIAALLGTSGKKIGLTVSPHVDSITERVQINGKPITDKAFCEDFGKFIDLIKEVSINPSYFELMIVFVLWEFEKQGVDYAVIETGLGGLFDSTNVLTAPNKVCVITDIGIDHTNILGSTLSEITEQKAGIIHDDNMVYMYQQSADIMRQIHKRLKQKHAKLQIIDNQIKPQFVRNLQFGILPKFQRRNWSLAQVVAEAIAKRDKFTITSEINPLTVVVPGRMEHSSLPDDSILIMDGSHNKQKMTAFVEAFQEEYPELKATIMLGIKETKDFRDVIDVLVPIASSIILTTFNTTQDLPAVSHDPTVMEEYAKTKGIPTTTIKDHKTAYTELVNNNEKIKIIIGSFYLLGQVRHDIF